MLFTVANVCSQRFYWFVISVYADKPEKNSVFERLQKGSGSEVSISEPAIRITGLDKPASSVFARLGGLRDSPPVELAGILKKSEKRPVSSRVHTWKMQ